MPKCPVCEQEVPKEIAIYNIKLKKYYHEACYQEMLDRKVLCEYVCELFDFKSPGPKIYSQMTNFKNKGISYKDMLLALKYHYEVKCSDISKSNGGIGIIPYVLQDAKEFASLEEYHQKQLINKFLESKKAHKEARIVRVDKPHEDTKKPKKIIDIDSL